MRVFTAIGLPDPVKNILAQESTKLGAYHGVRSENFHITLHFLGDLDENQADKVAKILELKSPQFHPFTIRLNKLIQKRDMLWAIPKANTHLRQLQATLAENLIEQKLYAKETRSYKPHVKIGLTHTPVQQSIILEFPVNEVLLMQTNFLPSGGIRYHALASFPLQ